jgi:hypothetical protein
MKHAAPISAVGALFTSGRTKSHVTYVDKDGSVEEFVAVKNCVVTDVDSFEDLKPNDDWAICGPGVRDARLIADLCSRTRAHSVSVSPLNSYQVPFGHLVGTLYGTEEMKPYRTRFCSPWDEEIDAEGQQFDLNLEGDGLGRMAHLVQARTPVVNQMMRLPGNKAFYERILSTGGWWGDPIFLMLPRIALKYFPSEPLSLRNYAATWVPVAFKNTDEFAKESGYGGSWVKVFVASEQTPGLGTFLRFLDSMSRDEFVASSSPEDVPIPSKIPLFRYSAAYNISADIFKEVVLEY